MRKIVAFVAAVAAFPTLAWAQPASSFLWAPPPPIAPADMVNYCVYESRLYSIGAGICFGRVGFVCLPSTGPATGNRAYWTSKDDQVFSRPICN